MSHLRDQVNELAELYRSGFYVFHDCPLEFGNVDHIAVGPPGVYAIETKFKRKGKEETEGHKLSFDQDRIYFPYSETSKPLEQASRQAGELRALLERTVGNVPVVPVVVYPGWYVTQKSPAVSVRVMNDKQLLKWLSKEARLHADQDVKKIAAIIDEKCRDVEV
ncbi:MAG: NERD domain-containing protein [Verrucomicrobiales bacterium]|nr:NERD domain-containing protein [Verrucomicrobiales bacterium]